MADTFDDGEDSEGEGEDGGDDRQRLMRGAATQQGAEERNSQVEIRPAAAHRRVTEFPVFSPRTVPATGTSRRVYGGGSASVNDGVFANLNAKPEKGEKVEEEKPPVRTLNVFQACDQLTYRRHMSKRLRTPHHHTGKPPYLLPAWYLMRSSLTGFPLDPCSRSSGTA